MPNGIYIEKITSGDGSHFLLPHEKEAVIQADDALRLSYKHKSRLELTEDIKVLKLKSVAPLIGAQAVAYADEAEDRVTLGSRVKIIEGSDSLVIDIVGYRDLYPAYDDEDEIIKLSQRSPLARLIIGQSVGSGRLVSKDVQDGVEIKEVDQMAIREEFGAGLSIKIAFEE